MVYGCPEGRMNCQKLFNLFCLYGNVVRIKFLKSKEGVAMIQMGDLQSVGRAIKDLNNCPLYGGKLNIATSKQAFIQDVPRPVTLSDGTESFMDFMGNRSNRFTTPEAAAKNRVMPPSKSLYFFNAPSGIKEEEIVKVFVEADLKPPTKCRIFPSKSEKSCTGILDFESKEDAVEALIVANHTPVPSPGGGRPFVVKFCFTGGARERPY
jgi:heterogeneous nuclear ribonucleoprotein L